MKYNLGFLPIYNKESKVLILGSFPSVISRKNDFYYGNRQNRFWKILEEIFNEKIGDSINEKTAFLLNHNIALWDVLKACDIEGSADSKINLKNSVPNDIEWLLKYAPNINLILFNGKKSYELFKKNFNNININLKCLPSTSPANIRFDFNLWKQVFNECLL